MTHPKTNRSLETKPESSGQNCGPRYTTEDGGRERVLWHCLLHVVNHGTQHRSEAAAILTGYGYSPGGLDFTAFLNEQPSRGG
jgi:uncharacterized damage-inducible protein DinB